VPNFVKLVNPIIAILTKFGMMMPIANKISQFQKSKMSAVAILKNKKSQYLSNKLTNFDEIWHSEQFGCPDPVNPLQRCAISHQA